MGLITAKKKRFKNSLKRARFNVILNQAFKSFNEEYKQISIMIIFQNTKFLMRIYLKSIK